MTIPNPLVLSGAIDAFGGRFELTFSVTGRDLQGHLINAILGPDAPGAVIPTDQVERAIDGMGADLERILKDKLRAIVGLPPAAPGEG